MDLFSFLISLCFCSEFSFSYFFKKFLSITSQFWWERGPDIALCPQVSLGNHYCFLLLGKMSVWGKELTNVDCPWCSPCQAGEDNRSLALERTCTHRHLCALPTWEVVCYLHEVFMPMSFAMKMGLLVVSASVKTEASPCSETALSSGACIGRNVIKGQIARADSQCSQQSDSTHKTPLHTTRETLTPV